MPTLVINTLIHAPVRRCFDLARSIDVHMVSTGNTREQAIAGVTKGLISQGETVTWRARHLGRFRELTTVISEMDAPDSFTDEQLEGPFAHLWHRHLFVEKDDVTVMSDIFEFSAPYGIFGRIAERLFLTRYMKNFLLHRNLVIKKIAESEEWKRYLE